MTGICKCVYICMMAACMYVCVYVYICIYIDIHTYICIFVCVCVSQLMIIIFCYEKYLYIFNICTYHISIISKLAKKSQAKNLMYRPIVNSVPTRYF